jgi:hypothetical protein
MVVSTRISGAVTALVIAVGACADVSEQPTAPAAADAASSALPNRQAMLVVSTAIDDESTRLIAAIQNADERARLSASLAQLSQAMENGDVTSAKRALLSARNGLQLIESDADRDALRLTLDAADESLSTTKPQTHGAVK